MSVPVKGSVIVATGDGKVTVISPTNDNQVLSLDSTDPKGAKFIDVKTILPKHSAKASATNANYTSSDVYQTIITVSIPGESTSSVSTIKVLSYCDSGITSYDIKVWDATNNLTIAEENFTNTSLSIIALSTLSNLPTNEAVLEIQVKKTGGNNNKYVYVLEATVEYNS